MPITTIAPSRYEEEMVWVNLLMAMGEKSTSQKLTISLRAVSGLNFMPTGICIQALATNIQRADKLAPKATSQVESK